RRSQQSQSSGESLIATGQGPRMAKLFLNEALFLAPALSCLGRLLGASEALALAFGVFHRVHGIVFGRLGLRWIGLGVLCRGARRSLRLPALIRRGRLLLALLKQADPSHHTALVEVFERLHTE